MKKIQTDIVEQVKECGIAKTHVSDLFDEQGLQWFNDGINYFNNFLNAPHIQERCKLIAEGNPIRDMSKWYELTVYEYLRRGLSLEDNNIINLYLHPAITDIAESFYGETPRVRNVLTWVHPENALKNEIASQRWHRDQEDWQIFKVFIYFSDVGEKNGALKYGKYTQFGGKYQDIAHNMNGESTSDFFYPLPEEDIVTATGEAGTVYFVNTNGLHKGGLVDEGIRCISQANFLKSSAVLIQNGVLGTFDYDPKVNILDKTSSVYQHLTETQKLILS